MLGRLLDGQFDRSILSSAESFADSLLPLKPILLHVYCTVEPEKWRQKILSKPKLQRYTLGQFLNVPSH